MKELVPLRGRGWGNFKPRPLRGSFQTFRRAPPSFLHGSPPRAVISLVVRATFDHFPSAREKLRRYLI